MVALAILSTVSLVNAQNTNLLRNPGFELGLFDGWKGNAKNPTITTEAHTGTKALKLPPWSGSFEYVYQDIPVTAGKVYTISAWIKQTITAGKGTSYLYYQYYNTPTMTTGTRLLHSQFVEYLENNFDWTLSKVVSVAPDGAAMLRVMLSAAGGPTTVLDGFFDDVTVIEGEYITNRTNVLINPGFESGPAGWNLGRGTSANASGDLVHGGSQALRIFSENYTRRVEQEVPAVEGEAFVFRGYTCLRDSSGNSLPSGASYWKFSYRGAANNYINGWMDNGFPNSREWLLMIRDMLIAPPGTAKFCVEAWVDACPGIAYFDDAHLIKLVKTSSPSIRLASSSRRKFQNGSGITFCDAFGRKLSLAGLSRQGLGMRFVRSGEDGQVNREIYYTLR